MADELRVSRNEKYTEQEVDEMREIIRRFDLMSKFQEFPKMLYKRDQNKVVANGEEEEAARKEGYRDLK